MFDKLEKPLIMGILNVTPDSFSDGGQYTGVNAALQQCQKMLDQGADIIDIGGESTRPGSESVDAGEQIRRVVPVIKAIRNVLSADVLISIDTTLAAVAVAALESGADIINDISAAQNDQAMLSVAAQADVPVILMHMQGTPATMQDAPFYQNAVKEILSTLLLRVDAALAAGIDKKRIIIDPGIGFGKRKQDNIDLLAHLGQFVDCGFPVLLGTSRKRFMGSICNISSPQKLVTATAVTTALGVMAGVRMFRVHDVEENRQAADIAWAIKQAS